MIFVNKLPERVELDLNVFAGDTKLTSEVRSICSCSNLQRDEDRLQDWLDAFLMKFIPNRCIVITNKETRSDYNYNCNLPGRKWRNFQEGLMGRQNTYLSKGNQVRVVVREADHL